MVFAHPRRVEILRGTDGSTVIVLPGTAEPPGDRVAFATTRAAYCAIEQLLPKEWLLEHGNC